jgi:hypothetical protein
MALHHLARDLRVTRLVRSYESDTLHARQEKERTDNDEGEKFCRTAKTIAGSNRDGKLATGSDG